MTESKSAVLPLDESPVNSGPLWEYKAHSLGRVVVQKAYELLANLLHTHDLLFRPTAFLL